MTFYSRCDKCGCYAKAVEHGGTSRMMPPEDWFVLNIGPSRFNTGATVISTLCPKCLQLIVEVLRGIMPFLEKP